MTGGAEYSVHFPMIENDEAIVEGPIISLGESWSGMYVKNYQVPNASTTWPEGVEEAATQRNTIIDDNWPAEIDIVTNRYIQFAIRSGENTTFTVDSIGMYAGAAGGNGMAYRVMIDTDANFANAETLENRPSNVTNTMVALSYQPIVSVEESETFYLRIYPWYTSAASGKYICLQNLVIKGRVKEAGNDNNIKNSNEAATVKVYPNPFNGIFTLENLEVSKDASIEVYNQSGVKVSAKSIAGATETVDLTNAPSGVYIVKVYTENHTQTFPVVKY